MRQRLIPAAILTPLLTLGRWPAPAAAQQTPTGTVQPNCVVGCGGGGGGTDTPPGVDITPRGTTTNSPDLDVKIYWCDEGFLNASTRWIHEGGTDRTASYSYESPVGFSDLCAGQHSEMMSQGTVHFKTFLGSYSITVSGHICDTTGHCTTASRTYTYVPHPAPQVSVQPTNGDNRDVGQCAAECFDVAASYTVPGYMSRNQAHGITLVYRSQQAAPHGTVIFDVTPPAGSEVPDKYSVRLQRSNGSWVTFSTNNSQELFWSGAADTRRLAADFYADSLDTGAHDYTLSVRSWWGSESAETTVPVRLLVANEKAASSSSEGSPYGWGWSIAGLQHLRFQADGSIVIEEGDGSLRYFAQRDSTHWNSPPGDFTTLYRISNSVYRRVYPDSTVVEYHLDGTISYVQDRFGNRTQYAYFAGGKLRTITDPAGKKDSVGYGTDGMLESITGPGGRRTWFTIDGSGNLTAITDPDGVTAFQASYNSKHDLIRTTDRRGGQTRHQYNGHHLPFRDSLPAIVADGQTVRPLIVWMSPERRLIPPEGSGTSSNPATPLTPDQVKPWIQDARGHKTYFLVDRFGAPTRIEEPLGRTTVLTRNANSQVTRLITPSADTVDYTWWDQRLTQRTDHATGRTVYLSYETTYNQVTHVYGDVPEQWYFYGARGALDSVRTGSSSDSVSRFQSDSEGRLTTATDPDGHETRYYYAPGGYQNTDSVKAVDNPATGQGRVTRFSYDGYGRTVRTVSPQHDTAWVSYDSLNRVRRQIGAMHDTTELGYDAALLTSVTDPKGQAYQVEYNALGWPTSSTDPRGHTQQLRYDKNGNVTGITDRLGQTWSMTYDALDHMTSRTVGGLTTSFATDPDGRFVAAWNAASADTVKLDAAGRTEYQITRRGTARYVLRSSYDAWGRRNALDMTAPWSRHIGYHWNLRGQLDTLVDIAGGTTHIRYNQDGLPVSITLPPGDSITRSYSNFHRALGVNYVGDYVDASFGLSAHLDSLGRLAQQSLHILPGASQDTVRDFVYDRAGRLAAYADTVLTQPDCISDGVFGTICTSGGSAQVRSASYSYDRADNRTDSGAQVQTGDWLGAFGGYSFTHDSAGRVTRKNGAGFDQRYYWNPLGQLDSVSTNGSVVRFTYDGFGRRVSKSSSTDYVAYLYDGADVLMELDNSGNALAQYTYYPGVDQPHSVKEFSGAVYYYARDLSGNVLGLFSLTNVFNRYRYGPWGQSQGSAEQARNSLRFASRVLDSETGLYYNRSRYYDPQTGRFLSPDPIGLAGGLNPYVYASDDPVNRTDPFGLKDDYPGGHKLCAVPNGDYSSTVCIWYFQQDPGGIPVPAPFSSPFAPHPGSFGPSDGGGKSNGGGGRGGGSSVANPTTASPQRRPHPDPCQVARANAIGAGLEDLATLAGMKVIEAATVVRNVPFSGTIKSFPAVRGASERAFANVKLFGFNVSVGQMREAATNGIVPRFLPEPVEQFLSFIPVANTGLALIKEGRACHL